MAYKFNEDQLVDYVSLSTDDEELAALEKEYLEGYDPDEILRAHKQEIADLQELMSTLAVVTEEYDPEVHAREAVENAYSTTLYLMYHMARRFHPLMTYGRDMLEQAKKLRMIYEKLTGAPMITGITPENSEAFSDLMNEDTLEDINSGKYRGIGLFRTEIDRLVPAAVAVYNWIYPPEELGSGPVIDVKWLVVAEEFRGRSLADFLIAELITLLIEKKGSGINLCVPVDEYYEIWLQLFSEWKFSTSTGINPEFRCCLKDVTRLSEMSKNMEEAVAFGEINPDRIDNVIRNYLKSAESLELFERYAGKGDYYDSDLSCFTGKESSPTGLLLAHIKPSGLIEIEYFDNNPESGRNVIALMANCLNNALEKYDRKTEVIMYPDSENLEDFLDRIVTKQRVIPMIDSSLVFPEGIDINDEDVSEIMKSI